MCGGDIQANEGATHGTCDFCGTTSTLPKASDERIVNLFNRANQQRQKNDFDKAMANYENILNDDATNAEAHWGVVLCRYGIEYVEDPRSHERIPTCHRVQYESILSDNDYLAALENAPDSYARELYENEAKKISEIQKSILAISNTEEPYDVFICYKETTDGGSRTKDSALAQDIYYQLEKEGYKTFFARITLEGKLGQQYEPYIFAALNSAKVMLVIGTDPAYFNAVWVRNEWSRYLLLMKKDRSKLLIPCYKDMDAYDIPNELSMFQSQDMGKIGFIQDLTHGIKKVISKSQDEKTKAQSSGVAPVFGTAGAGVDGLLKRAFIFLEDGDFKQAGDYCDRVLDIDPENARAYVGLLLVELKIKKEEELSLNEHPIDQLANYHKAVRYSDDTYRNWLEQCNQYILDRSKEKAEQERERQRLLAEQQQREAKERAEQERYNIYNDVVNKGNIASKSWEYLKVIEALRNMGDYKDAPTQVEHFQLLHKKLRKKEKRRKRRIAGIIVTIMFSILWIITSGFAIFRYNRVHYFGQHGVRNLALVSNDYDENGFINRLGYEVVPSIYTDITVYGRDPKTKRFVSIGSNRTPSRGTYFTGSFDSIIRNFIKGQDESDYILFVVRKGLGGPACPESGWGRGVLSKSGKVILPHIYDEITILSENAFMVSINKEGAGILDKKGKEVVPIGVYWSFMGNPKDGYIIAYKDVGWRIIDLEGNEVSPIDYPCNVTAFAAAKEIFGK